MDTQVSMGHMVKSWIWTFESVLWIWWTIILISSSGRRMDFIYAVLFAVGAVVIGIVATAIAYQADDMPASSLADELEFKLRLSNFKHERYIALLLVQVTCILCLVFKSATHMQHLQVASYVCIIAYTATQYIRLALMLLEYRSNRALSSFRTWQKHRQLKSTFS